jgi:hypothetical protein
MRTCLEEKNTWSHILMSPEAKSNRVVLYPTVRPEWGLREILTRNTTPYIVEIMFYHRMRTDIPSVILDFSLYYYLSKLSISLK